MMPSFTKIDNENKIIYLLDGWTVNPDNYHAHDMCGGYKSGCRACLPDDWKIIDTRDSGLWQIKEFAMNHCNGWVQAHQNTIFSKDVLTGTEMCYETSYGKHGDIPVISVYDVDDDNISIETKECLKDVKWDDLLFEQTVNVLI